jgi:hypothetical protein
MLAITHALFLFLCFAHRVSTLLPRLFSYLIAVSAVGRLFTHYVFRVILIFPRALHITLELWLKIK